MNANTDLPDPDDFPDRDIVIWDGQCVFCRGQVLRLRKFDSGDRLSYISLHDPRVGERFAELSFEQLMDQLWLVTSDGRKLGGADAGRLLSRKLPTLWWLAPLLHIPFSMPLWRWVYKSVANRRYKIAGKNCSLDGTCHLHGNKAKTTEQERNSGR